MGLTEPAATSMEREGRDTGDDREREVTLWTDSFDPRQALTLGPRLVRGLSRLPQVYDVGLSVPGVELVRNTGVALASF